jgi:DnaK suppressor protein
MRSEKVVGDQGPTLREELARSLKQERARLHAAVGALVGAGKQLAASQADEGRAGSADADVASDLAEAELDLGLERAELARLAEVEDALDRLEAGGFGTCARCEHPIDVERLRILPWTKLCSDCADSATR